MAAIQKVQFETRQEVFQIIALEIDELFRQAKDCHTLKQIAGIRLVKNDEEADLHDVYPNLFHCARRISLCARRITMAIACGLKVRRFWLGKMCRVKNYENITNFFYKGPSNSKQFTLEDHGNEYLNIFDRACPVDLIKDVIQNHLEDGSFDQTVRVILFQDDLKEVLNLRTRIRGRVKEDTDCIYADTSVTSTLKVARLKVPMFKKPSYWLDGVNTYVLIGLESSL